MCTIRFTVYPIAFACFPFVCLQHVCFVLMCLLVLFGYCFQSLLFACFAVLCLPLFKFVLCLCVQFLFVFFPFLFLRVLHMLFLIVLFVFSFVVRFIPLCFPSFVRCFPFSPVCFACFPVLLLRVPPRCFDACSPCLRSPLRKGNQPKNWRAPSQETALTTGILVGYFFNLAGVLKHVPLVSYSVSVRVVHRLVVDVGFESTAPILSVFFLCGLSVNVLAWSLRLSLPVFVERRLERLQRALL